MFSYLVYIIILAVMIILPKVFCFTIGLRVLDTLFVLVAKFFFGIGKRKFIGVF